MRCSQCGKEIEEGTKFCTQCGAQLVDDFSMMHDASTVQPTTSIPARPEPAPAQNRMPSRPERAPVQAGTPQHAAPSKDNRKLFLLIGVIAGAALLVVLIVVIVSAATRLSGKIDLTGAAAALAAAGEQAAEDADNDASDALQSMADAATQSADADGDASGAGVMREDAAAPENVQENTYAEEAYDAAAPDMSAYYLLPESDSRYYTEAELGALSSDELRLARNEIFARHGRMYESEDLREYFYAQPWYEPLYTAEEFDPYMEEILNQYEKANVETIKELENGDEERALYTVTVDAPDNYVNLREGPGTDYGIIMEIRNGVVLNIYDERERGRWLLTEYRGYTGWVASSQVSRN